MRLLVPPWNEISFAPLMSLKELSLGWQKKIVTAADQERRLEKTLKDLTMLKTTGVNTPKLFKI